eukprot:gnl/Carplike_NY0171/3787_a5108_362.p1 GENE.gnl/Carplike_NY0171/3787_a5108_362~~gnl/Carplike_NY0171/3787_a5108_362.p1  ORF type:complete len:475 (-),score=136.08 gnl/Carplike_NY0171/3787_a5108_362:86-1357(-)
MSTRACRSATSLDTFITQLQMYREQVLPDIESGVTVVGIIKTELKDLVPQLRALLDKIAASMSHDNGASRKEMMAQKHAFETVLDSHTKSITSLDKALKSATCIQTKEEADLRERLNASCKCAEKYREDNSVIMGELKKDLAKTKRDLVTVRNNSLTNNSKHASERKMLRQQISEHKTDVEKAVSEAEKKHTLALNQVKKEYILRTKQLSLQLETMERECLVSKKEDKDRLQQAAIDINRLGTTLKRLTEFDQTRDDDKRKREETHMSIISKLEKEIERIGTERDDEVKALVSELGTLKKEKDSVSMELSRSQRSLEREKENSRRRIDELQKLVMNPSSLSAPPPKFLDKDMELPKIEGELVVDPRERERIPSGGIHEESKGHRSVTASPSRHSSISKQQQYRSNLSQFHGQSVMQRLQSTGQ